MPLEPYDRKKHGRGRRNRDGSTSTELSIGTEVEKGRVRNSPSIWWAGRGKKARSYEYADWRDAAKQADKYEKRTGKKFPRYKTEKEATRAAIRRSKQKSKIRSTIAGEHAPDKRDKNTKMKD